MAQRAKYGCQCYRINVLTRRPVVGHPPSSFSSLGWHSFRRLVRARMSAISDFKPVQWSSVHVNCLSRGHTREGTV